MLGFAEASSGIHISLRAEHLFTIGPVNVTNSMLYGLIVAFFIAAIFLVAARKIKVRPARGFSQFIEMTVDFVIGLLEGPLGSRAKAVKYAPVFGYFFLFIIINNLMGLLPLVGPGLYLKTLEGNTPLLRPFTADLNGTIAMAVIAIVAVQIMSIREQGGIKHLQHYFTNKPWNPLNLFIGILEVFGELTRIASLSLRLFLNTAVGEILIAVFTSMIIAQGRTPFAALPIFLFETLVAGIQAYVFTILAATYLGLAISHAAEDHHTDTPGTDTKVEQSANRGETIHVG